MNYSKTLGDTRKCSYETLSPDVLLSPPATAAICFSVLIFHDKRFAALADQTPRNFTLANQLPVTLHEVVLHFPLVIRHFTFCTIALRAIALFHICFGRVLQATVFYVLLSIHIF
jgi:hypothetical protein